MSSQLRAAKAFATLFLEEAQNQLDGRSSRVPETVAQLSASLEMLREGFMCSCGHRYDLHEGIIGGVCLNGACPCPAFHEKEG